MCTRIRLTLLAIIALTVWVGQAIAQYQAPGLNGGNSFASGERRVALVIGNAAYESSPLRNPVNDVRAMAAALKDVGFEVAKLENATRKEMKQAIDRFGTSIQSGGVGLFYFSGHGMQVKSRNYLIPIGTQVLIEPDVDDEAVDLNRLLGKMESATNAMNIVILDACRVNPFARSFRATSEGLAQVKAPTGTFIAYATAPDSVAFDGGGRNGLYTEQLIRYIRSPGLKIEEVFKAARRDVMARSNKQQVPWDASSITGDFYFAGLGGTHLAKPIPAPVNPAVNFEEEAWADVKDSHNPEAFADFLVLFPRGSHARTAWLKEKLLRREQATPYVASPSGSGPLSPLTHQPTAYGIISGNANYPEQTPGICYGNASTGEFRCNSPQAP